MRQPVLAVNRSYEIVQIKQVLPNMRWSTFCRCRPGKVTLQKQSPPQVFLYEFLRRFFKNSFLQKHLQLAASSPRREGMNTMKNLLTKII